MKKLKNKIKILFYVFILFPFFRPNSIGYLYPSLSTLITCWSYVSIAYAIIITIKHNKVSKGIIFLLFSQAFLLLSHMLSIGRFDNILMSIASVIALAILIDTLLKHDTQAFLQSTIVLFEILVIINAFTLLFWPNGMYINSSLQHANWFLGYKNTHILYILPLSIISYIYYYKYSNIKNKNFIFIIILCLFSVFFVQSGTSVVAYVLFIFFLLSKIPKTNKLFNIKNYSIVFIILFFAIIIFRLQSIFSYIIVDVLDKSMTFTGRTSIWDTTLIYIKRNPLLGFGVEGSNVRILKYGFIGAISAHNQILELLYQGGFVYFASIILFFTTMVKKLNTYKNHPLGQCLAWGIFIYYIMFLMEYYSLTHLFYILLISYNIELLIGGEVEDA